MIHESVDRWEQRERFRAPLGAKSKAGLVLRSSMSEFEVYLWRSYLQDFQVFVAAVAAEVKQR